MEDLGPGVVGLASSRRGENSYSIYSDREVRGKRVDQGWIAF